MCVCVCVCKYYNTCHSWVRWCAPCSSDTRRSLHHIPPIVRYIHRLDRTGNPRIPTDSDHSVDRLHLNDMHTDLWSDRIAPTLNHEGHTHMLETSQQRTNQHNSFKKKNSSSCRIRLWEFLTFAAARSESKCQWCTRITTTANHIRFTFTEPSQFTTERSKRASNVTPASWQKVQRWDGNRGKYTKWSK